TRPFADKAADIHFRAGFCEREERRAETDFCVLAEHFTGEVIQRLLQVGKADIPVDVERFHLVKEAMRPGGYGLIAVYPSRHDGANGRPGLLQEWDLHVRGMCPQKDVGILLNEERVLHFAGGMVFGKVECREIVPVVLDLRTLFHIESETLEDRYDPRPRQVEWV